MRVLGKESRFVNYSVCWNMQNKYLSDRNIWQFYTFTSLKFDTIFFLGFFSTKNQYSDLTNLMALDFVGKIILFNEKLLQDSSKNRIKATSRNWLESFYRKYLIYVRYFELFQCKLYDQTYLFVNFVLKIVFQISKSLRDSSRNWIKARCICCWEIFTENIWSFFGYFKFFLFV